jgi:hypothetical protein
MLGRELPSQLIVDHNSVSAAHCCLLFDGIQLWVVDAGSTNKIRTTDGSAAVIRLQDRQVFAAGRVQFKVAIPTDLVPLAELEKLRAEFAQHELELSQINQAGADLARYRFDLESSMENLRAEQDDWLRRRGIVNREIEVRLSRLKDRETALDESIGNWQAHQAKRTDELDRLQADLVQREVVLSAIEESWNVKQAEADEHWNNVAEEVRRHKLIIRQQQAELQQQNELSVVQRIRIQRELKEREENLNEREKQLIRREVQIEAAQRRFPRDVSNPNLEFHLPSDSISDSTVLAANDFIDILDQALDKSDRRV